MKPCCNLLLVRLDDDNDVGKELCPALLLLEEAPLSTVRPTNNPDLGSLPVGGVNLRFLLLGHDCDFFFFFFFLLSS